MNHTFTPPRRHSALSWLLLAFASALYCWTNIWNAWHGINSNDFKHIYFGMKALLDGISPYTFEALHHQAALQGYDRIALNPYVYLPFTGHAMGILAPFNFEQAQAAWFILNHIFVAASLWMISSLWPHRRVLALALLTLAMGINFPLYRTLTAGQLNCALLFMICLGWRLMRAGRPALAGIVMAFATLYKLMPGIYVLYFLLRRRWRAFFAMAIAGPALFLVSMVAGGINTTLDFFPVLNQMGYGKSTWSDVFSFWDDPPNQSLNSFFSHIFALNDHTRPWAYWGQQAANTWTIIATLLLLAAYVVMLFRSSRPMPADAPHTTTNDPAFGATLILGLLTPSLLWDHYLSMLILPAAIMVQLAAKTQRRWAVGLVTICWLLMSTPWHFELPMFTHGAGILLMSMKLWPTLILFGLSLCFIYWKRNSQPAL